MAGGGEEDLEEAEALEDVEPECTVDMAGGQTRRTKDGSGGYGHGDVKQGGKRRQEKQLVAYQNIIRSSWIPEKIIVQKLAAREGESNKVSVANGFKYAYYYPGTGSDL